MSAKTAQETLKGMDFSKGVKVNTVWGTREIDYLEIWSHEHGNVTEIFAEANGQKTRGSFAKAGGIFVRVPGGQYNKRQHVTELLGMYSEQKIEWEDGYFVSLR